MHKETQSNFRFFQNESILTDYRNKWDLFKHTAVSGWQLAASTRLLNGASKISPLKSVPVNTSSRHPHYLRKRWQWTWTMVSSSRSNVCYLITITSIMSLWSFSQTSTSSQTFNSDIICLTCPFNLNTDTT